ncbi:MAG TPA: gliding motility-associated protein GldE, partial [Alistipes sp.]|nr:gliding motility-associated protein GldE [Alistipes sp.]
EEIVGEISDESDAEETFYSRIDRNTYLFDGKTHIGDFARVLDLDEETFSDVKGEAETLAGLLLELKRNFPKEGDAFTAHDVRFVVQTMVGHRVDKIKVIVHEA